MYKKKIVVAVNLMGYSQGEVSDVVAALNSVYDLFPRIVNFRLIGTPEYLKLYKIDNPGINWSKVEVNSEILAEYSLYTDINDVHTHYYNGLIGCLQDVIEGHSNVVLTTNLSSKISKFINCIMAIEYQKIKQVFHSLPIFQIMPIKMGNVIICGVGNFDKLTRDSLKYYLEISSHASHYVMGVVCPRVGIIDLFEEINFKFNNKDCDFFYRGKVTGNDLVNGNVDVVVVPDKITKFLVDLVVGTGYGTIKMLQDNLNDNFLGNLCSYFGAEIFENVKQYYSQSYTVNSIMWSGINNSVIALHESNISYKYLSDVIMFAMQIHAYARLINTKK